MTRAPLSLVAAAAGSIAALGQAARADNNGMYELKTAEAKVAAGAKGSTSLTISAKGGWHVNEEAPITLALTPDPGLTLAKTKLARADLAVASKEAPRFDIAFTAPPSAGKTAIHAEARFVMCEETACRPVKEKLTLPVEVTVAGAPKRK